MNIWRTTVFPLCYPACSEFSPNSTLTHQGWRQLSLATALVLPLFRSDVWRDRATMNLTDLLKWSTTLRRTKGWTTTFSTASSGIFAIKRSVRTTTQCEYATSSVTVTTFPFLLANWGNKDDYDMARATRSARSTALTEDVRFTFFIKLYWNDTDNTSGLIRHKNLFKKKSKIFINLNITR